MSQQMGKLCAYPLELNQNPILTHVHPKRNCLSTRLQLKCNSIPMEINLKFGGQRWKRFTNKQLTWNNKMTNLKHFSIISRQEFFFYEENIHLKFIALSISMSCFCIIMVLEKGVFRKPFLISLLYSCINMKLQTREFSCGIRLNPSQKKTVYSIIIKRILKTITNLSVFSERNQSVFTSIFEILTLSKLSSNLSLYFYFLMKRCRLKGSMIKCISLETSDSLDWLVQELNSRCLNLLVNGLLSLRSSLSHLPCDILSTHHIQFNFKHNIMLYSNHHLHKYMGVHHSHTSKDFKGFMQLTLPAIVTLWEYILQNQIRFRKNSFIFWLEMF
ncbi:hypothetical protein VP01_826g2 [Puccinia sorghi]|uniref:Uncharacterized protein n=1 Tax=Puccinia sorghi TaxID=27349 RepID=A0A0L6UAM3_9BASI|nr:hypothetical protein VP01_826g2 [Puccinia sorghi]